MKEMIISVVLIAILTALVIFDSIYVTNTIDGFLDETYAAEYDDPEKLQELYDKWESESKLIALTIGEDYVHSVQCSLGTMKVFSENDQKATFEAAKNETAETLSHIRRHHSFSLDNVI